ncbi:hypothetical protein SAMN05421693_11074 [Ectothiorhodospira magna]|uniref:Uncharacterized protein n=2 Tax=Ectothiorhodospira magna TaxID=867345 RepID=A0A1H9BT28_9GAMM|nr:hypothetical protein SAMN05421693_11074 [Ectothiorhodospira magna]
MVGGHKATTANNTIVIADRDHLGGSTIDGVGDTNTLKFDQAGTYDLTQAASVANIYTLDLSGADRVIIDSEMDFEKIIGNGKELELSVLKEVHGSGSAQTEVAANLNLTKLFELEGTLSLLVVKGAVNQANFSGLDEVSTIDLSDLNFAQGFDQATLPGADQAGGAVNLKAGQTLIMDFADVVAQLAEGGFAGVQSAADENSTLRITGQVDNVAAVEAVNTLDGEHLHLDLDLDFSQLDIDSDLLGDLRDALGGKLHLTADQVFTATPEQIAGLEILGPASATVKLVDELDDGDTADLSKIDGPAFDLSELVFKDGAILKLAAAQADDFKISGYKSLVIQSADEDEILTDIDLAAVQGKVAFAFDESGTLSLKAGSVIKAHDLTISGGVLDATLGNNATLDVTSITLHGTSELILTQAQFDVLQVAFKTDTPNQGWVVVQGDNDEETLYLVTGDPADNEIGNMTGLVEAPEAPSEITTKGAGFDTREGDEMVDGAQATDIDNTITIADFTHMHGSTLDGVGGSNTVILAAPADGGMYDFSELVEFAHINHIQLSENANTRMNLTQHALISTAAGDNTVTIVDADNDSDTMALNAEVENYTLTDVGGGDHGTFKLTGVVENTNDLTINDSSVNELAIEFAKEGTLNELRLGNGVASAKLILTTDGENTIESLRTQWDELGGAQISRLETHGEVSLDVNMGDHVNIVNDFTIKANAEQGTRLGSSDSNLYLYSFDGHKTLNLIAKHDLDIPMLSYNSVFSTEVSGGGTVTTQGFVNEMELKSKMTISVIEESSFIAKEVEREWGNTFSISGNGTLNLNAGEGSRIDLQGTIGFSGGSIATNAEGEVRIAQLTSGWMDDFTLKADGNLRIDDISGYNFGSSPYNFIITGDEAGAELVLGSSAETGLTLGTGSDSNLDASDFKGNLTAHLVRQDEGGPSNASKHAVLLGQGENTITVHGETGNNFTNYTFTVAAGGLGDTTITGFNAGGFRRDDILDFTAFGWTNSYIQEHNFEYKLGKLNANIGFSFSVNTDGLNGDGHELLVFTEVGGGNIQITSPNFDGNITLVGVVGSSLDASNFTGIDFLGA